MHKWTNKNTAGVCAISTGPTPDESVKDLVIEILYDEEALYPNDNKAKALDGHIIPLLLRVPEMRDTLRELGRWLQTNGEYMPESIFDDVQLFVWKINQLIAPTREELDAQKNGV